MAEQKPQLSGVKIKARKGDKQKKADLPGFRDDLLEMLGGADDYSSAAVILEENPAKLDYREYDEVLFDVLVAGGLLAPGGGLVQDGAETYEFSVFEAQADDEDAQLEATNQIASLVRRYKYLGVSLEESFTRLLKFVNGFKPECVIKLAKCTASLFSMSLMKANPLLSLLSVDTTISSGVGRTFLTQLFKTWLAAGSISQVSTSLRKAQIEQRMEEFFPMNDRSPEAIIGHFEAEGDLGLLARWYAGQRMAQVKARLERELVAMLKDEADVDALVARTREVQVANKIAESEVVKLVWAALVASEEWSKKSDIVAEQAIRLVSAKVNFLGNWMKSDRAQIVLLNSMQEYAYTNQSFIKIFKNLCLTLYTAEYLGEDAILAWYANPSTKGKSTFLAEMKEFYDWLKTAPVEPE